MSQDNTFNAAAHDFDWSPYPNKENANRWSAALKAELVTAVHKGQVNLEQIQARYPDLSEEELAGWINRYNRAGLTGLKITKTQMYRDRGITP